MNTIKKTNCLIPVTDFFQLKEKVLHWVNRFGTFCFLDNHQYQIAPHSMECLVAAGVKRSIKANAGTAALNQLEKFISASNYSTWYFGHLGYDLKNEIENLSSHNPDDTGFDDLFFFEPKYIIKLNEKELMIEGENAALIAEEILNQPINVKSISKEKIEFSHRFSKEEYVRVIKKIQEHIRRGDCYEINFCQEFFSTRASINPLAAYLKLSEISPNPFSALYKNDDRWLLCASPERFLAKRGDIVFSQPIKGTSKRKSDDEEKDRESREWLRLSAKDRSENVMVVDLVRNDLSKFCRDGSVQVEELFGIYSFPQVHQMISTISGRVNKEVSFTEMIKSSFPMGSMTGAPKKRVMELIEQYESRKRGIFSGALGYISPEGDFDFNVVIRSLMYHAATGYLSYQVGSGITHYSNPQQEWDECIMKAEAMRKVFR